MKHRMRIVVLNGLLLLYLLLTTACVPHDMFMKDYITDSHVMEEQVLEEDSTHENTKDDTSDQQLPDQPSSRVAGASSETNQTSTPAIPQKHVQASSVLEHKGTKTSWDALRATVTAEINEHQKQIQQLNLKLQLIDQIATKLELTTTAHLRRGQTIVADFVIENPTTYVLKDIAISCDQIASTGTIIRTNTETIYAIVPQTSTQPFEGINLGKTHRHTESLACEIKNFTVHTPKNES